MGNLTVKFNTTPTITESELQAEYAKLDLLREKHHAPLMTDEQFKLISHARSGANPVTWNKLSQYWESRGWGAVKLTTLKCRFRLEQSRRK